MAEFIEGGCRCGAARYKIDLTGAHTLACHCTDCQKHLGAPCSVFTIVPAVQFHWLREPSGKIAFSDTADRLFCRTCGTYLKWEGKATANEAEINAMTLDDPCAISVNQEIYTRSRLKWIQPIEGADQSLADRS